MLKSNEARLFRGFDWRSALRSARGASVEPGELGKRSDAALSLAGCQVNKSVQRLDRVNCLPRIRPISFEAKRTILRNFSWRLFRRDTADAVLDA